MPATFGNQEITGQEKPVILADFSSESSVVAPT
jgi:hypothetical protein